MEEFGKTILRSLRIMIGSVFTALLVMEFINKDFITSKMGPEQGIPIVLLIVLGFVVLIVVEVVMRKGMNIIDKNP